MSAWACLGTLAMMLRHRWVCNESTGECRGVVVGHGVEEGGGCGEPPVGGRGDVTGLGEDRAEFADDVADGAAADLEQFGKGLVGAQLALIEHGRQDLFGVGDLLGEDTAAGTGQAFSTAST